MKNTIYSDLQKSIKENLPAMVADQMLAFIEDAKKTDGKLEEALGRVDALSRALDALRDEKSKLEQNILAQKELAKRATELDKIEKEVERRERELELTLAWKRNECLKENTEKLFDLVSLVFKNPIQRETIIKSVPVANQSGGYPAICPENSEKTVTLE